MLKCFFFSVPVCSMSLCGPCSIEPCFLVLLFRLFYLQRKQLFLLFSD